MPRKFVSYVSLSEESRRKLQLPNLRMIFEKPLIDGSSQHGELTQDLRSVMRDIYDGAGGDATARPADNDFASSWARPASIREHCLSIVHPNKYPPNPNSRITLGRTTDAFGLRTTTIDWQLTAEDKRGMTAGHRLFGVEIGHAGLGRFRSFVPDDDTTWPKRMFGNHHNIGTTRMHRDARLGVVDGKLPRSQRRKPVCSR